MHCYLEMGLRCFFAGCLGDGEDGLSCLIEGILLADYGISRMLQLQLVYGHFNLLAVGFNLGLIRFRRGGFCKNRSELELLGATVFEVDLKSVLFMHLILHGFILA